MEKFYTELAEKSKKKQELIKLGILAMAKATEVDIDGLRSAIEMLDDEKHNQIMAEKSLAEIIEKQDVKERAKKLLGSGSSKQGASNE